MKPPFSRYYLRSLFAAGLVCFYSHEALAQTQAVRPAQNFGGTTGGLGGGGGFGGGGSGSGSNGVRQYTNSTMAGDAMITSDFDTRRIIVVTDEETNKNIAQIISNLDKPKPQVLINVVFVQVTHDTNLDIGTQLAYHERINATTTNSASTSLGTIAAATGTGGFYSIANTTVDATISALSSLGKTEVLSRPSILTRSSQQATITVGQQVPIPNGSTTTELGSTINTLIYKDVGIILKVTPFITLQGMVEMIVSPQVSSISGTTVQINPGVNSPVIDIRSADTVVVTPSDKTIVIGGMISSQTTNNDTKVPILGDIPLIGYAFKHKVKATTKTELMIFLTPHVVQNPGDLDRVSDNERTHMEIAPKVFDKNELKKYVPDH